MLTTLIRTSYRPKQFRSCIASIPDECPIIVSYDDDRALEYIRKEWRMIVRICVPKTTEPFGYNLYCNTLKDSLITGHGLFIDDDDTFIDMPQLQDGISYIVPFMRGNFEKPDLARRRQKIIQSGYIGLPCLILWHEHARLITFDSTEFSDYNAIKSLSSQVKLEWLDEPVVKSEKRGWGRTE